MLAEQTFLNAGPLLVKATEAGAAGAALAGFTFNVLLIARAPLQLFQAIQTSILPHLTRLRAGGEHDPFKRSIHLTLLAIAAFAGAVALVMAVIGPGLMDLVFGDDGDYERGGLVIISVGMGLYLAAATLNQAALARGHTVAASSCWALSALAFVAFLVLVEFDNRVLQVEMAYTSRRPSWAPPCSSCSGAADADPRYWNGPPSSGNGGYTCGMVAALLEAPSAEVSLRAPPPLETELAVERDGDAVRVIDGETLVAEGRPVPPVALEPPRAVTLEEAEAASRGGLERWSAHHPFPTCVVCGPERNDGMGIYPGALDEGEELWAARWTGRPEAEQVWAALDCPSSAPVASFASGETVVLARLQGNVQRLPADGEPLMALSWALRREGRKREAASALVTGDGEVVASAQALWIQLRKA